RLREERRGSLLLRHVGSDGRVPAGPPPPRRRRPARPHRGLQLHPPLRRGAQPLRGRGVGGGEPPLHLLAARAPRDPRARPRPERTAAVAPRSGPRPRALGPRAALHPHPLPDGGATRICAVVLRAQRRFAAAGAAEVAFQLSSIAALVAFHGTGGTALVWAQVVGAFVQLLVAARGAWRQRRLLRPVVDLGATPVRRLVRLTLPVYLGDSGDKINLMVTRGFASALCAGAISGLQSAYTLVDGLQGLLAGTLVTTFFPYLSQRVARADERGARVGLHRVAVFAALVALPLAAALALAADPLVVFLFERGSFDE